MKNSVVQIVVGLLMAAESGAASSQEAPLSCSDADQKSFYARMFKDDQEVRTALAAVDGAAAEHRDALFQRMQDQDAVNQRRLDAVVDACGWPEASSFLNSHLEVAFFVVQHSHLDFTLRYQERIEKAHAAGKIPERNMADFRRYLALKRKPYK